MPKDFTHDPVPDELPDLGPPTRLRASRLDPMARLGARLWLLRQLLAECYAAADAGAVGRIMTIHQHIEAAWALCDEKQETDSDD